MPTISPNSIFIEYNFTDQEWINARVLTELQLARLQTIRAQIMKKKATTLVPEDATQDRSWSLQQAELQGQIDFITVDLIDAHYAALKELNDPNKPHMQDNPNPQDIADIATRASKLVHQNS